ncbi:MAG: hypothetical protein QOK02_6084 [Mycobacterium sp.]|nr:hypothetical protein [Mycobacterium sp.]
MTPRASEAAGGNSRASEATGEFAKSRLPRRLLVFSAPVALLLVVALLKLCSVVIAGGLVASDFAKKDTGALRTEVATLNALNIVEPAKAHFAAGALAVLDGRLEYADEQFSQALARTGAAESCETRVNLELVRETLGDKAAGSLDGKAALARYRSALSAVNDAPAGCFAGNADPDSERRVIRDVAAARLNAKIDDLQLPPPPPANPPPAPPPAAPPPAGESAPDEPDSRLRLNPDSGDPLQRLQQILRDAAAAQNGG